MDRDLLVVSIGADQDGALDYEACAPPLVHRRRRQRADDLLLLQYTSGTTGFPKGAMHTHETVLWNSLHQIPDFGITRDDVHLVIPAMCWAAGFHSFTLAVMWAGGQVVINPSRGSRPRRSAPPSSGTASPRRSSCPPCSAGSSPTRSSSATTSPPSTSA